MQAHLWRVKILSFKPAKRALSFLRTNAMTPSRAGSDPSPWGFIKYHTMYGDESRWKEFRKKLDNIVKQSEKPIINESYDTETLCLKFVEDGRTLKAATLRQIRSCVLVLHLLRETPQ